MKFIYLLIPYLLIVTNVYGETHNTKQKRTPDQMLQQLADYYRTKLPMKTNEVTTMTDVVAKNRDLIMTYRITGMDKKVAQYNIKMQHTKELQKACMNPSGYRVFFVDKSSYVHMFYDDKFKLLGISVIDETNCEKFVNSQPLPKGCDTAWRNISPMLNIPSQHTLEKRREAVEYVIEECENFPTHLRDMDVLKKTDFYLKEKLPVSANFMDAI